MKLLLQILLPLLVLGAAAFGAKKIADAQNTPAVQPPSSAGPLVRIVTAEPTAVQLDVATQGTVEARTAIDLAAQVGGRIVAIAPTLRSGGFFDSDEVLVEIDPADYQLAIVQQEAAVSRAGLRLLQERAEAETAVRAWRQLEGDKPADPLVTRAPQVAEAEKALAAAQAALARGRLDLERTKVRAPFPGRVRSARADIGQTITPGQPLAVVYAIDYAEVRLPIPDQDVAFLDLPLHRQDSAAAAGPAVTLRATFGGAEHEWRGIVDRVEGEIDRRTRQITVVARIEQPYAAPAGSARPPLALGMFVQAKIQGRQFADVVAIPRAALRADQTVWVVDDELRLRRRQVDVLRVDRDQVVLRQGLAAGERVCVTALETPTDGMFVRLLDASPTAAPEPRK